MKKRIFIIIAVLMVCTVGGIAIADDFVMRKDGAEGHILLIENSNIYAASFSPRETISGTIAWQFPNKENTTAIYKGRLFGDWDQLNPIATVHDGLTPPLGETQTENFTFTAPTEPGIYVLRMILDASYSFPVDYTDWTHYRYDFPFEVIGHGEAPLEASWLYVGEESGRRSTLNGGARLMAIENNDLAGETFQPGQTANLAFDWQIPYVENYTAIFKGNAFGSWNQNVEIGQFYSGLTPTKGETQSASMSFTVPQEAGIYSLRINLQASYTIATSFTDITHYFRDFVFTVSASVTTHTITASTGTGGTISPSGAVTVNDGANQTFTISANSGYQILDVKVAGFSLGAISTYTFSNVTRDWTIAASFAVDVTTHTITASTGTGGTISPSGAVTVNDGANQTFTISANSGYQILDVKVDGVSQGAISTYTFSNVARDWTIAASFAVDVTTHTITASTGTGGTISPSGAVTVNDGANQTFTISANSGYQILDVKVDGVSQGAISTYTFSNVARDWTIAASFAVDVTTHTITASTGTGGTISPSGAVTVNDGANQTFTISANSGYQILDVKVDGVSQGAISTYTFSNVARDWTIAASFAVDVTTHTITASTGTGGTISPSGAVTVNDGANQTFTISANSGYQILDVKVDGVSQGAISTYTFSNVARDWTIAASFAVDVTTHTITASTGTGGTISPSGAVTVNDGANQTFTISANSGYQILDVKVDGVSQGAISTYTFSNVTGDHAISASFAVTPPITAEVTGKITNIDTGEGLSEATVSFDQGEYVLTTASDGTFSSSVIPAGTYEVEISATNYYANTLSKVTLSADMTNDLSSALTPKSPEIVSTGANPDEVYNDGATTTLLTAKVTHPDGSGDISSVIVDLAQIGGSASQEMYDDGTYGDAVSGDGTYSYQATVATATPVQQFSLNVTASDLYGFKAYANINLKIIKKIVVTAQPEQVDTHTITNSLSNQTLVVSFKLDSLKTSKYGGFQGESECYVELTVYKPDGTVYDVYNVTESIDISIPNAEAGDWEFKTVNKCTVSVTYEIETKGSGTGMLVGRVTNAYTGLGIVGATVTCNTGGSTVTLDDGYFSGVAVAGTEAAVTSTATGYHTDVQVDIAIVAGDATSLTIQMISDASAAQPVPSSQQLYVINEPKEDPDPLTQPFAAKELQGNLYLNALFPLYQKPVNIYVGVTPDIPGMAGKIFLFNKNNELVELTDTLYPWREGVTASQSSQILSCPLSLLPAFSCIFYSMVTTDPVSLSNYDLVSFTLSINQAMGEGTILVIEDEEVLVKMFRQILERLGYRVLQAMTGKEAVELASTFDGQIDLALLDIKLPDMDGGRVYPLIMDARPDLKVLVCSDYSIDGPAREILDAGAQDFIQKPFSIATLSEKLKEVWGGK